MTSFPDYFSDVSSAYAAYRPNYPPELLAWLASRAGGTGRCWDAATGNGQVARVAAAEFAEVVATDASSDQIAHAVPALGVRYLVEPAERPSLAPGSVDLVTIGAGAHWLDRAAFYEAAARVGRPGSLLAMFSYGTTLADEPVLNEALAVYIGDVLGPWWTPEFDLVSTRYQTLAFPFPELSLPLFCATMFGDLEVLLGMLRTWSAAARMGAETGRDPIAPVADLFEAAWRTGGQAPEQPRLLRWPIFGRIGQLHPPAP